MNDEEITHRLRNAVVLLNEGHGLRVGELTLWPKDKTCLMVSGWTSCNHRENVTKDLALSELGETKMIFSEMTQISKELQDFIKDKEIEYRLGWDYGQGSITICHESKGEIIWKTELSK